MDVQTIIVSYVNDALHSKEVKKNMEFKMVQGLRYSFKGKRCKSEQKQRIREIVFQVGQNLIKYHVFQLQGEEPYEAELSTTQDCLCIQGLCFCHRETKKGRMGMTTDNRFAPPEDPKILAYDQEIWAQAQYYAPMPKSYDVNDSGQ